MESTNDIHIGILFNAIVCGMVAISAAMLAVFLLYRWQKLTPTMKAYAWFWVMTTFIWLPLSLRYAISGLGKVGPLFYPLALLTQIALSMCGPPLIYYLAAHLRQSRIIVWSLTAVFIIFGAVGIWYDLKPDGLIIVPFTYFSAETTLNAVSLRLYLGAISVIFLFLFVDIWVHCVSYYRYRQREVAYETLYSLAIAAYLILGSLEVVAFITDWLVVVFRTLYIGTFLTVFLIIKNYEATSENYLLEEKTNPVQ